MIKLDQSAVEAAQIDHFANPPTHAKLVRYHVVSIMGDQDLLSQASDMKARLEGTYVYGSLNDTGEFVRTPRTPFIPVILPHGGEVVKVPEPIIVGSIVVNQPVIDNITLQNNAINATRHIINAGVAPHPDDPTTSISVPNKPGWTFREEDFDAVSCLIDKRLAGKVV